MRVGRLAVFISAVALIGAPVDAPAGNPPVVEVAHHAWIGVSMDSASANEGVLVRHVVRGSPADKAGLRGGDSLVRLDGAPLARPDDVTRVIAGHAPGEVLSATAVRASA